MRDDDEEDKYSDSSDDDSGSDSEEREEEEESRSKKSKKKKKKKEKKKKKKKKDKKKDKKKKKKKKKKKSKSGGLGAIDQLTYGARGILRAGDRAHMYEKKEEFLRWLIEVKDKQPSMLNRREEEDFFSMYCEDFNTCTLPDEKYYDVRAWEMKEAKKRGLNSVQELYTNKSTMTDEEKAAMERRALRDREREEKEQARTFMLKEQLKKAKATDSAAFREIEERNRATGPETFESIALKRKRDKEARDDAITKKLRGF